LRRRLRKAFFLLLLVSFLLATPKAPTVAGAGSLYLSPAVVTPLAVNSTFSILVKVASFDQFNGWEIQIVSDPTVISATNISTAGNIFLANTTQGIPFPLRNCVNGNGTGCCLVSCTPLDGPGIADSAYGYTKPVAGFGLLFNVTFKVVSNKDYSPILIENDQLSGGGPGGFVVHTTTRGSYGIPHPDFSLSANPPSLGLTVGSSKTSAVSLTSIDNFSGLVVLTVTPSSKGITATLNQNQVTLAGGGTAVISLVVQALANASATSYAITLFANSSSLPSHSLPHTTQLTITVHSGPDFQVYATPSTVLTNQASSNSTTITVISINNFTGTVDLTVVGPTPASLDKTSLMIPSGGSATSTLTITTQSSPLPFEDDFIVNATSGLLSRTAEVVVRPPPGDFSISANPATATVQAGNTEFVSIGVSSRDYFVGTVYIFGTSKAGLGFSFDPGSIFLNISQTVFFKLKVTTDASTTSGDHTIDLTVYGQQIGIGGQGVAPRLHAMNITLTVSTIQQVPARTFLGLQEPIFYGIIGGLAIIFAVLGILEVRRANRPKSRPILER
jgi:hypothetical protein